MTNKQTVVCVSGGYDPVHVGHLDNLKAAYALGDKLVVILNTDEFLLKKKGYVFMTFEERKEILENFWCVDRVIKCIDEDMSVCKTLEMLKPDIFAKGGDRTADNIPEVEVCQRLGIKMMFDVGGGKTQSSSRLVEDVLLKADTLKHMFDIQSDFSKHFFDASTMTQDEKVVLSKEYILSAIRELSEVLNVMPWKQHRKYEKNYMNREEFLEEMIDVFKFWLNIMLIWEFTPFDMSVSFTAKSLKVKHRFDEEKNHLKNIK